jgi:hypothetical protein
VEGPNEAAPPATAPSPIDLTGEGEEEPSPMHGIAAAAAAAAVAAAEAAAAAAAMPPPRQAAGGARLSAMALPDGFGNCTPSPPAAPAAESPPAAVVTGGDAPQPTPAPRCAAGGAASQPPLSSGPLVLPGRRRGAGRGRVLRDSSSLEEPPGGGGGPAVPHLESAGPGAVGRRRHLARKRSQVPARGGARGRRTARGGGGAAAVFFELEAEQSSDEEGGGDGDDSDGGSEEEDEDDSFVTLGATPTPGSGGMALYQQFLTSGGGGGGSGGGPRFAPVREPVAYRLADMSAYRHVQDTPPAGDEEEEEEEDPLHDADAPSPPDSHEDVCHVCGDGGRLLCCDGCPLAFHVPCVGLQSLPHAEWLCAACISAAAAALGDDYEPAPTAGTAGGGYSYGYGSAEPPGSAMPATGATAPPDEAEDVDEDEPAFDLGLHF